MHLDGMGTLAEACHCIEAPMQRILHPFEFHSLLCEGYVKGDANTQKSHSEAIWDCCFARLEEQYSHNAKSHWIKGGYATCFASRKERLAEIMLSILPPCLGGDVRDWQKVWSKLGNASYCILIWCVTSAEMDNDQACGL